MPQLALVKTQGGTVSPSERSLLQRFCRMLAQYGGELQTL